MEEDEYSLHEPTSEDEIQAFNMYGSENESFEQSEEDLYFEWVEFEKGYSFEDQHCISEYCFDNLLGAVWVGNRARSLELMHHRTEWYCTNPVRNPLVLAAVCGYLEILEPLFEYSVCTKRNICKKHLVAFAVMAGHVDCVDWLRTRVSQDEWNTGVLMSFFLLIRFVWTRREPVPSSEQILFRFSVDWNYAKYFEHYALRASRHEVINWYDNLIPTVCPDGTIAMDLYLEFMSIGMFRHSQHMAQLASYSTSSSDLKHRETMMGEKWKGSVSSIDMQELVLSRRSLLLSLVHE